MLRTCIVIVIVAIATTACSRKVGDECDSSLDCATGQLCDRTLPGGYCVRTSCVFSGCPEEAVCVRFTDFDSYCMLRCGEDGDCRSAYVCVQDTAIAPAGFCAARVEDE